METRSRSQRSSLINAIAVLSTLAFLIGMLIYLSLASFRLDFWLGFRSVVASILPAFIMAYLATFTRVFKQGHPNQRANVFIIYAVWTVMLLLLGRTWDFGSVPVMELLVSATLASIIWRSKKRAVRSNIFACCYGVLTGLFTFICFFKIVPIG